MRFALVGLLAVTAAVAAAALAASERARPLPGLPAYTAGFESWPKLNRRPIPPRRSDPHHGWKNIYVNQPLRRVVPGRRLPYGAVVVKTAAPRAGSRAYSLVAVMRKVRGANPRHNDWVMVEYTRRAAGQRFRQLASGAVCTGCHVQARARDYVFTNVRR